MNERTAWGLTLVAVLWLVYAVGLVIYRLFLHPLAHIPGPPLAIATYLYEWYYDIYLGGQYTFHLKVLHKQYGPIIRISPDEVHIDDPDYLDEVYNQTNKVEKPLKLAECFGPYPAAIGTQGHDLHRIRRAALNPFFSRKSVQALVPVIQRVVNLLCQRFEEASKNGEILNMKYFYAALTTDVIVDFCFSRDPEIVLQSDFGRKAVDDLDKFVEFSLINIHIPGLMRFLYFLPDTIVKFLAPAMADMLDFRQDLSKQVEAIRHGKDRAHEKAAHRTLFHELLESKLPPQELKRDRLRDEAFSMVTAGSSTTAWVLRGICYHVSANPPVRQRLYEELKMAMPDPDNPIPLPELERLPYLTAVINEGLRLQEPAAHRLGRVFTEKTLNYHGTLLPPGTLVGMTTLLMHQNEEIFPDYKSFQPERWLGNKGLERYLAAFSRGYRACLGINLARAELYIVLATVYRRFDFDVSRVNRERDIDTSRDVFLSATAKDSPGVQVKIKAVHDSD